MSKKVREKRSAAVAAAKTYACLLAQFFVYLDTSAEFLACMAACLLHQNAYHFGL